MSLQPSITSASIFPRLRVMLGDDIESLNKMLSVRTEESKMYNLIASLLDVKIMLIRMIPGDYGYYEGGATTRTKSHSAGYTATNVTEVKDQVKLVSILLSMETDQLHLVRNALASKGLPSDLHDRLSDIARVYVSVVDQLGRSKKTQQLNSIIVKQ